VRFPIRPQASSLHFAKSWSQPYQNPRWRVLPILRHPTLLAINAFRAAELSASLPESGTQGSEIMAEVGQMAYTRTIRRQQLREIVPLADSTIFGMEQRGEFPRRFALSPRCVVWDLSEVEEWLASRRTRPIERGQQVDVRHRRIRPVKDSDQVPA
jgi:prophage regulatory protein